MHQMAHTGKGKTIMSSGQMEMFQQTICEKSRKVGGHQCIVTKDGYVIPINIRSGLPYVTMRPYTDRELDRLPQVHLTSDLDWDPKSLDDEMEDDELWFDSMKDLPTLSADPLFDEFSDYQHTHDVLEAIMADSVIENSVITDLPMAFKVYERQVRARPVNFEALRPKFGWLPASTIEKTWDSTTQFYCTPMSSHMKKTYEAPFPALNVHRQNEDLATDYLCADTPAIDEGSIGVQFFVGTTSMVGDVYGVKSQKQFVNTLQDNICRRGAPNRLISDRAQSETSEMVQDILRHLIIGDWQSEPHYQHQNPAE